MFPTCLACFSLEMQASYIGWLLEVSTHDVDNFFHSSFLTKSPMVLKNEKLFSGLDFQSCSSDTTECLSKNVVRDSEHVIRNCGSFGRPKRAYQTVQRSLKNVKLAVRMIFQNKNRPVIRSNVLFAYKAKKILRNAFGCTSKKRSTISRCINDHSLKANLLMK